MLYSRPLMDDQLFRQALLAQMAQAPSLALGPASKIAILSDFHMGDGSANDDLRSNGPLLEALLERRYLAEGYTLVLNGDIEELQKFPLARVRSTWKGLYSLFDRFARDGRLHKILGNHDEALLESSRYPYPLHQGLVLLHGERRLYAYHGHQASSFISSHNDLAGTFIRYFARGLGIRNRSPSKDSRRRYKVERRIYEFSRGAGIVSIIGHTHRPLFESLSKYDRLRFEIERLCVEYADAGAARRAEIAEAVGLYKEEYERLRRKDRRDKSNLGLYGSDLLLPCLFNSGCAIGKKGVTALEIEGGLMHLAYWFEEGRARRYLELEAGPAERLEGGPYRRAVLAGGRLDDAFARMDLLA
jgi:predicted phosphodiesterase